MLRATKKLVRQNQKPRLLQHFKVDPVLTIDATLHSCGLRQQKPMNELMIGIES